MINVSPIEIANFSFEPVTGKVLTVNRAYATSIKGSGGGGSISGSVHMTCPVLQSHGLVSLSVVE